MGLNRIATITLVLLLMSCILFAAMVRGEGGWITDIEIVEQSGYTLSNYTVVVNLNATNWDGWGYVSSNGSDIYFLDDNGNPLYYWIEYFNATEKKATILVRIPEIPANGRITIHMYFGSTNPYSEYNDRDKVYLFYDDFNDLSKWSETVSTSGGTVTHGIIDGKYRQIFNSTAGAGGSAVAEEIDAVADVSFGLGFVMEVYGHEWFCQGDDEHMNARISLYNGSHVIQLRILSWSFTTFPAPSVVIGGSETTGSAAASGVVNWKLIVNVDGSVKVYKDGTLFAQGTIQPTTFTQLQIRLYTDMGEPAAEPFGHLVDKIMVRSYVEPEPLVRIGVSVPRAQVVLPSNTAYLVHEITYVPNASQFQHSFSATNASTANYVVGTPDPYGWKVYAEPYQSGGTGYENVATLISEVNITLPYSEVLVKNVTLLARTNGTGTLRQLWVKVLNSTGEVVAELTNATLDTGWTENTLTVNANLSGQITIWINATVKSTATAGEEIAVKDVRVYVEYESNPQVTVPWSPNVDFFNCSASHYVELGSPEYLNSSVITFKLIQYLTYNATDYPIQPVYVGDETIGSYSYSVYRVDPANFSQYMTIYALLENKLKTFRTHAKGYDTETILVGEPLTVELPETGNVTVVQLNKTYANVLSVTVRFNETGVFTIVANLTKASLWRLGYGSKSVTVKYGAFSVKPLDVDSKVVNYENLVLQLINSSGVVRELTGNQLFSLSDLWADNYTLVARFKDIVVANVPFELNITTDASTANLPCAMKSLARDYRGLNRSVVFEHNKQLLSVENVSSKYPFSRMRILLNGTGMFKLYINYRGDLPTKVAVVGNVTNLNYFWDGNYLVITGTLGSIGELNVTDLYKLRVEIYDRLGNYMPSWIYAYINNTKYTGAVVEDYLYPEDYVVKLPTSVNGFEFYSFFDGFNESSRVVSINNTDITLKAWFRVPTSIEVRSYQVSSMVLPLLKQEGNETVRVYVEGYLRDYYGNGVPNKPLTVNITNVETKYTKSYNVTSDVVGYFRTPIVELARGKTYIVEVVYGGDDIYVGTLSTVEVKPEELPVAPAVFAVPVEYLLIAVAAVLVAVGAFAAARAARQTVEELREKRRKFVKKKK